MESLTSRGYNIIRVMTDMPCIFTEINKAMPLRLAATKFTLEPRYRLRFLLAQDFFHCFTLGKFIDHFVEITNFTHEWIFNFFHSNTANDSFD